MSEQISDRRGHSGGRSGLLERVQGMLPARFRRGTAVVPVVRLSGVIGAVTPLRPGMMLSAVRHMLVEASRLSKCTSQSRTTSHRVL